MDVDVPVKLRERLGPEATGGLLHVLDAAERSWRDDVLSVAAERFERRLAEGTSTLRVQVAQSEAALRHEIGQLEVRVRHEIGQLEVRVRHQIGQLEVRGRTELGQVDAGLREAVSQMEIRILRELGNNRFDLLKWSFLFWIGQVVAMSAIMAAMLRIVR